MPLTPNVVSSVPGAGAAAPPVPGPPPPPPPAPPEPPVAGALPPWRRARTIRLAVCVPTPVGWPM